METLTRRQTLILIIIAILVVAGFFIYDWKFRTDYDAFEFVGVVEKVEGDIISLKGVYVVPDHPEVSSPADKKNVSVTVIADTKFVKTSILLPTSEELKKTGGTYKVDDLKKEVSAGTIEDIAPNDSVSGFSIRVKSAENIYNKSSFIASEINYIVPVYP